MELFFENFEFKNKLQWKATSDCYLLFALVLFVSKIGRLGIQNLLKFWKVTFISCLSLKWNEKWVLHGKIVFLVLIAKTAKQHLTQIPKIISIKSIDLLLLRMELVVFACPFSLLLLSFWNMLNLYQLQKCMFPLAM